MCLTFFLQNVTESVVYVTLNHTEPSLATLLRHHVLQRCEKDGGVGAAFECAPHYDSQPNASE